GGPESSAGWRLRVGGACSSRACGNRLLRPCIPARFQRRLHLRVVVAPPRDRSALSAPNCSGAASASDWVAAIGTIWARSASPPGEPASCDSARRMGGVSACPAVGGGPYLERAQCR